MSDKELAKVLTDFQEQAIQAVFDQLGKRLGVPTVNVEVLPGREKMRSDWLDWLRQEVSDGDLDT